MLGLMIPFSVWIFERSEMVILRTLWIVIFAGGTIVAALYGLDRLIELELRDMEALEREQDAKN